jgi:4-methyl-5(b-hydroxyethyl)-thiazole monophosphate biosynthesis
MSARVLVAIANGVEEIETTGIVDTLRRGEIEVTVAKVPAIENDDDSLVITASRQMKLVADVHFRDIQDKEFDMIVLPGGAVGAKNLSAYAPLIDKLRKQKQDNKWYAAICASPAVVFAHHKLLDGIEIATCHPSVTDKLKNDAGDKVKSSEDRVVVSHNCITSRGTVPNSLIFDNLKVQEQL